MPSIKHPAGEVPAALQSVDAIGITTTAVAGRAVAKLQLLPLRNRNIGVLCGDLLRREAAALHCAATELGARVALVRSELDGRSGPGEIQHTARVLGRLYDAVLCVDMPSAIVRDLREAAGIPVISDETGHWGEFQSPEADAVEAARLFLLAQLAGL